VSTDQPPGAQLNNREALFRVITRISGDLTRAQQLVELIGITEPAPAEVTAALETLRDWAAELVRHGRPPRPKP